MTQLLQGPYIQRDKEGGTYRILKNIGERYIYIHDTIKESGHHVIVTKKNGNERRMPLSFKYHTK